MPIFSISACRAPARRARRTASQVWLHAHQRPPHTRAGAACGCAPLPRPSPVRAQLEGRAGDAFVGALRSQVSRAAVVVVRAAQGYAHAATPPRFGQTSGPGGFQTLPVINIPLGQSPNDPTVPLQLQLEVMVPECECTTGEPTPAAGPPHCMACIPRVGWWWRWWWGTMHAAFVRPLPSTRLHKPASRPPHARMPTHRPSHVAVLVQRTAPRLWWCSRRASCSTAACTGHTPPGWRAGALQSCCGTCQRCWTIP